MWQTKFIAAICLGKINMETINRKILVTGSTGSTGFIGSALVLRLLTVELMDYITALEKALGQSTEKQHLPLQAGDVPDTYADVADLVEQFHYKPAATVEEGIKFFVAWYRNEFKLI
jgi:nucleoside-diphosphate-sugar epimerase